VDDARHAGNASPVGIKGLSRLTLFDGLAHGLCEEHDEASEPKAAFAGSYWIGQKMAGGISSSEAVIAGGPHVSPAVSVDRQRQQDHSKGQQI